MTRQLIPHWGGEWCVQAREAIERLEAYHESIAGRMFPYNLAGRGKTCAVMSAATREGLPARDVQPTSEVTMDDYDKIWGTKVGKDCIDLKKSLARWLGKRLKHLGKHTHGSPMGCSESDWEEALRYHGAALLAYSKIQVDMGVDEIDARREGARDALQWVADHFEDLWD